MMEKKKFLYLLLLHLHDSSGRGEATAGCIVVPSLNCNVTIFFLISFRMAAQAFNLNYRHLLVYSNGSPPQPL